MNAAEKLAREVVRVTKLRCQYEETGRLTKSPASVKPAITLMEFAIEQACKALGADDAQATLRALKDLEGFTE